MKSRMATFIVFLAIVLSFPQGAGAQWVQTSGPGGGTITALAVCGLNIFAGTEDDGVFLSADNGASWIAVSSGLPALPVLTWSSCLAVGGSDLFVGVSGGGVWRLPLSDISSGKRKNS